MEKTKRCAYMFGVIGLVVFVLPLLLSFIDLVDKNHEVTVETGMICMLSLTLLTLPFTNQPRRSRIKIFLISIIPIFGLWLLSYSFWGVIREYTINWPKSLFKLAVMMPLAIIIGLFMIWLTSQPTPKQIK